MVCVYVEHKNNKNKNRHKNKNNLQCNLESEDHAKKIQKSKECENDTEEGGKITFNWFVKEHTIHYNVCLWNGYLGFVVWFILPVFVLSRLFTFVLPFIMLGDYLKKSKSIGVLQLAFTTLYGLLIVCYTISFKKGVKFHFCSDKLWPRDWNFYKSALKTKSAPFEIVLKRLNLIDKYYQRYCDINRYNNQVEVLLVRYFGNDIGQVMIEFVIPLSNLQYVLNQLNQEHNMIMMNAKW